MALSARTEFDGFVPPQNIEAEMSALGSMLLSEQACDDVLNRMQEEDLYLPAHREVYKAIRTLRASGMAVDLVSLKTELVARDTLKLAGGVEYLIQLAESVATAANAATYAGQVQDQSVLRSLDGAGQQISKIARDREMDLEDKISQSESLLFNVGRRRLGKGFTQVRTLAKDVYLEIDNLMEGNGPALGLATGYEDMDKITTGFYPGDLVIVAARPAMGKTSLVMNFATEVARIGGAVAVFSLEMTGSQLVRRMTSTLAKVPMSSLKKTNLHDKDYHKLTDAIELLYRLPIYIDDTGDISPMEMRGKCRRLAAEDPNLKLVIVDYLQLMRGNAGKKHENRTNEIGDIARSLKLMAKELNLPVIALAQVNRAVESRDDKRPALSDLRESGSIEAEADIVMSIYRKEYYDKKARENIDEKWEPDKAEVAEIGILKHRNGPTGTVLLAFQPAYTRFSTLDQASKDDYKSSSKGGGED
jgi:replicative DNA helicase